MAERPAVWTSRLTTPGAGAFALLFGLEALGRALVTVALPIQTLHIVGSDEAVSAFFLLGSLASVSMAFVVPWVVPRLGRARLCSLAIFMILAASGLFMLQLATSQAAGFVLRDCGVAVLYAVLSMFIMDHIARKQLGRSEPLRMLSIGVAWTIGPLLGVWVEALWGAWAPFATSGLAVLLLLAVFWTLRFSELPIVAPAADPAQRRTGFPALANLLAFARQPRLRLAFLHALARGIYWKSFTVYTPLFAVESGLGAAGGGVLVAIGSGFMVLIPVWGWTARRFGIRRVSLLAGPAGAACCLAAFLLAERPWLAGAFLLGSALAMSVIDGYGNALFFRACKPSQRTVMTPIFSAQRETAAILHAGFFALLLIAFPIKAVFLTLGLVLAGQAWLSLSINPRL